MGWLCWENGEEINSDLMNKLLRRLVLELQARLRQRDLGGWLKNTVVRLLGVRTGSDSLFSDATNRKR